MRSQEIGRGSGAAEGGLRGWFRHFVAGFRPFILVTTTEDEAWPVDTKKAGDLRDRVLRRPGGEGLADKILQASVLRSWIHPDSAEMQTLIDTISDWVSEEGEEAVGEQLLNLREALRRDLGLA